MTTGNFGSNTVKGPPTMYPKRQFVQNADGSYREVVDVYPTRKYIANGDGTYREIVESGQAGSSASDKSENAVLSVTLDTGAYGARTVVEIFVKSNAAATFTVEASTDNTTWRTVGTIVLTAAGEQLRGYRNAYRYIKVGTTAANNNEIEIVAS